MKNSQNHNINESSKEPLSLKVTRGGKWITLLRIANRSMGFLRTLILARLLAPEDFGLFGVAMIALSFLDRISQTGFHLALVREKDEATSSLLDTAWTVSVLRGILLFIALVLSAGIIAEFFHTPDAVPLIHVIAAYALITGFNNIGVVYFQKDLDFKKSFIYEISYAITDFLVAFSIAIIFRSVWALVWAGLAARSAQLVASFVIHPYRPNFRLKKQELKHLLGFGKWVLISGLIAFFVSQGDVVLIGKMLDTESLGLYRMAFLLSTIPTSEFTTVFSGVTYPAYSKLQDNIPKLRHAYFKVLSLTAMFVVPVAGLLYVLAKPLTIFIVGDKWLPMVPALQTLCIYGVVGSIAASMSPVLYSMNRPHIQTFISGIQLSIMMSVIYPMIKMYNIQGAAVSILLAMTIAMVLIVGQTRKVLVFGYITFFKSLLPWVAAAMLACLIVWWLQIVLLEVSDIMKISISIIIFLSVYLGVLAIWERTIFSIVDPIKEVLILTFKGLPENRE